MGRWDWAFYDEQFFVQILSFNISLKNPKTTPSNGFEEVFFFFFKWGFWQFFFWHEKPFGFFIFFILHHPFFGQSICSWWGMERMGSDKWFANLQAPCWLFGTTNLEVGDYETSQGGDIFFAHWHSEWWVENKTNIAKESPWQWCGWWWWCEGHGFGWELREG